MIELLELYEKKKFEKIYEFSEKHFPKTKIHKIITREYLSWINKGTNYTLKIKLCEELDYQMKKQEILLSISRHESRTLYDLFKDYGDEYKKARDPHLAKKLYYCALECIENFD